MQFEQNPEDLTRKALDVESLGVLTSAFDLSQYVSTGNSITLQLTFKCFLFDRKFRITLWDLGWCSTVRNGWAQNPELIYIISHHLFCARLPAHMYTIRQRQTLESGVSWSCMIVCKHPLSLPASLSLPLSLSLSLSAGIVPPFESKVQHAAIHTSWNKSLGMTRYFSHTFTLSLWLSLCVSFSHTHYFTVLLLECVCAGADCETDEWPAMADS